MLSRIKIPRLFSSHARKSLDRKGDSKVALKVNVCVLAVRAVGLAEEDDVVGSNNLLHLGVPVLGLSGAGDSKGNANQDGCAESNVENLHTERNVDG